MSDLVSIHDEEDVLVGSGVLVTDYLVLTCAHVINTALGQAAEPAVGQWVKIRFNGAPGEDPCEACVDAVTSGSVRSSCPARRRR